MVALVNGTIDQPVDVAEGVEWGYRHYQKEIVPRDPFVTAGTYLKWYEISAPDRGVTEDLGQEARAYLTGLFDNGELSIPGELGFVIVHDCVSVTFLMIGTWRNSNELWESVYIKNMSDGAGFRPMEFETHHRGTYCVWEMGAVCYESQAWTRYLLTERTTRDRTAYLSDMYAGPI